MTEERKKILLGIDLEEFDIPEEYGQVITTQSKIDISKKGLFHLLPVLEKHSVKATYFTTAFWGLHEPSILKELSKKNEIASHSFYHSSYGPADLRNSRETLSVITGQEVTGFRMPRMHTVAMSDIANAGYRYDSSLNPTWLPGRYNHLDKKRVVFKEAGIYEMPVSVSHPGRIPLFWLTFKNLPLPLYFSMARRVLKNLGYLIIYIHPWEFVDLNSYKLPWFIKRHSGNPMVAKLDRLLQLLSQLGDFETHNGLISNFSDIPRCI